MANIKIDDKEYDTEKLSEEAKKQVVSIRLIDQEIARLQLQLGIANTARNAHAGLLKKALK